MARIMLIKVEGGFVPATKEGVESFNKIKKGDVVYATITKPRNPEFHRKFFAMLTKVAYNLDVNEEDLLDYIKEKTGRYKVVSLNGEIFKRYDSISFATMDNIEFSKFYDESVECMAELLGADKMELLDEFTNN